MSSQQISIDKTASQEQCTKKEKWYNREMYVGKFFYATYVCVKLLIRNEEVAWLLLPLLSY